MNDKHPTRLQIERFERAAIALAALGTAGLHVYLANDTLNLMTGPSHDADGRARHDRVVASVAIPGAGGGDW